MFCDAYLEPRDLGEARRMAHILSRSGYKCVGVKDEFYNNVKNAFEERELRVLKVITLDARDEGEARSKLKKLGGKGENEIIIGRANGPSAFRFFSRDSRIDVVEASRKTVNLVDKNEASILQSSGALIGVNMGLLLKNPRNISWMGWLAKRVFRYDIPFVIYSSARRWNQLWHPRHVYSLFQVWIGYGRYAYLGLWYRDRWKR